MEDNTFRGFPIGVQWWGGQFGQNGQKLHENDKFGIFGSKQWGGGMGGTSQFFGLWGGIHPNPPPVPPPLGETLPLVLIKNTLGECFIFYSNLDFNVSLNSFPEFHINIFHSWKNTFAFLSFTPSCIRSQFLWFNKDIKKLITNHFIFRIFRKRILILLNIYSSRLEFLKAGVK